MASSVPERHQSLTPTAVSGVRATAFTDAPDLPPSLAAWADDARFLEESPEPDVVEKLASHHEALHSAIETLVATVHLARTPHGHWPGTEGWQPLNDGKWQSAPTWQFNDRTEEFAWAGDERWRKDVVTTSAPMSLSPRGFTHRGAPTRSTTVVSGGLVSDFVPERRELVRSSLADCPQCQNARAAALGVFDPQQVAELVRWAQPMLEARWAERDGVKYLVLDHNHAADTGLEHTDRLWFRPDFDWALVRREHSSVGAAQGSAQSLIWQGESFSKIADGLWLPLRTTYWVRTVDAASGADRGHLTLSNFTDLRVNVPISPDVFVLEVPEDTLVVER